MSEPTPESFRSVMSRFATGVSVMTTVADGVPHGMTANAVSSVSLDPLLVLVCVEKDTVMADMVARSEVFGLSFLRDGQTETSSFFASPERPLGNDQWADVDCHTAKTGVPLLDDCLAWLDCEVWARYDGGDHDIVVGRVVDLHSGDGGPALVYFRHGYVSTAERAPGDADGTTSPTSTTGAAEEGDRGDR